MAFKSSEFYYWDGAKWVLAVTNSGSNALADVRLLERLGNPMKMGATLSNFPLDWQSSVTSERQGPLTDVFKDYQQVMIRDGETHQIMFSGRIYKKEATYDPSVGGNIIRIEAFDSLAELRDFSSAGLKESTWKKFSLEGVQRSAVAEALINDSLGSGIASPSFVDADGTVANSAGNYPVSNIVTADQGAGAGTRFRFETSVDTGDAGEYITPARTGVKSILGEIANLAANDQHTSNEAEKDRGYTYYVDPNFAVPKPSQYYSLKFRQSSIVSGEGIPTATAVGQLWLDTNDNNLYKAASSTSDAITSGEWELINWTHNPPTMLNYFKRGTRPSTTPATYGLTTKFGVGVTNRTGTPGVLSYPPLDENDPPRFTTLNATKLVTANYQFEKPSKELYSHAIVSYNGKGETEGSEIILTQHMEILYVSSMANFTHNNGADGNAFYKGKDLHNHTLRPQGRKSPPGKLQWNSGTVASPTWVDTNAYVHMATDHSSSAVTGSSTAADYEGIVIGVKIDEESAFNYQVDLMQRHSTLAAEIRLRVVLWNGSAFAVPSGGTPIDGFTTTPTCTFNSTIEELGKGQTRHMFGINRPKRFNVTNTTAVDSIRKDILGILHRTNMDIRRGQVSLIGPPHYSQDFTIRTSSNNVITLDNIEKDESSALNVTTFGIKVGMVVMMFGTDSIFGDDNEAAYGHITAIASDNTSLTLSTVGSYSADDYIRVFIPIRAGDFLRMDCAQDAILGNHFITDLDYVESRGTVNTTLKTIGHNEDITFVSGMGIPPSDIDLKILEYTSGNSFGWDVSSIPYGQRPFELEGITFTRTDRDTLSWSSGFLKVGGEYYSIVEGNTGALSTLIPDDETQCQPYYIYWNSDISASVLQVAPTVSPITVSSSSTPIGTEYIPDSDDIVIATARAGNTAARDVEYEIYGREKNSLRTIDTYRADPGVFIEDGAMTAALQRKGTQPFSSNITFTPTAGGTTNHPTGHHSVTIGHNSAITNAQTISFADGKTATCATTSLNLSTGESTSADQIWYIYFDLTGITPSGGNYASVPISATTSYAIPNTDMRGLLAMAAISTTWHASDATVVGQLMAIQTFGSKIGNVNADNIAANSVTANAIQAGSVATAHISGTLAGNKLSIDSSTTFASGYNPSTANSLAATKAKIFVDDDPPTSVSIGDLWIDSNDNSKLYRAEAVDANEITSGEWVLFDLGLARATADTGVTNAATAQGTANRKRVVINKASTPALSDNGGAAYVVGDMWIHSGSLANGGGRIYINDGGGTAAGNWDLRDDAGAISNATTDIAGGRINTQAIILTHLGSSNIMQTGDGVGSGARVLLHNTGIIGSDASANQFSILSETGKAEFGGGKIVLDSNGLTLTNTGTSGGYLRSGTKTYAAAEAGFFIGRSNSQYQFDIGSSANYLRWSGSALSIKGTITLSDGTAEAAIKNSAVNAAHVGLGNVPNYSAVTMMQQDHQGTINSLPISTTTDESLRFSSGGISAYSGGALKATMSASGAAFTVYGPGGTAADAALKLQHTVGGSDYISYISAGAGESDMRYDARYHYFYNFGTAAEPNMGKIRGLASIYMDYTGTNAIYAAGDLRLQTDDAADQISFYTNGALAGQFDSDSLSKFWSRDHFPLGVVDDLGGTGNKWYRLYAQYVGASGTPVTHGYFTSLTSVNTTFGDMNLSNMAHEEGNDFDGTKGNWIIQEGSDDLFIKNNRTGKKYKFKLEEV